eukprot:4594502-Pleurochrysis_carterae.AAC.1
MLIRCIALSIALYPVRLLACLLQTCAHDMSATINVYSRSVHVFDVCIRSSAGLHRLRRLAVFWSSLFGFLYASGLFRVCCKLSISLHGSQRAPPFGEGPTTGDSDHNYSVEEHQAWMDKACGVISELQEKTVTDLSHVRA